MSNHKDNIKKEIKDITITDQNWLMYKHIQAGRTVKEAYALAGYKGNNPQAPYQLWHKLNKKFEVIWDADNADSLRLKMEAKKIADMPLKDTQIKAETKLKAIETLHKLQDKEKKEAKTISPFIIQKFENGSTAKIEVDKKEVVDVKPIDVEKDDGSM